METLIGFSRWNKLYNKAYWLKANLDTTMHPTSGYVAENLDNFLSDYNKCPTRGQMAMHDIIKKRGLNYPKYFSRNINSLRNSPDTDYLVKFAEKNYKNLYPKTAKIRKKIIMADRINCDIVMPKLKNAWKKLLIKF